MERLRLILKIVKSITEIFLYEVELKIERKNNENKLEERSEDNYFYGNKSFNDHFTSER